MQKTTGCSGHDGKWRRQTENKITPMNVDANAIRKFWFGFMMLKRSKPLTLSDSSKFPCARRLLRAFSMLLMDSRGIVLVANPSRQFMPWS